MVLQRVGCVARIREYAARRLYLPSLKALVVSSDWLSADPMPTTNHELYILPCGFVTDGAMSPTDLTIPNSDTPPSDNEHRYFKAIQRESPGRDASDIRGLYGS